MRSIDLTELEVRFVEHDELCIGQGFELFREFLGQLFDKFNVFFERQQSRAPGSSGGNISLPVMTSWAYRKTITSTV